MSSSSSSLLTYELLHQQRGNHMNSWVVRGTAEAYKSTSTNTLKLFHVVFSLPLFFAFDEKLKTTRIFSIFLEVDSIVHAKSDHNLLCALAHPQSNQYKFRFLKWNQKVTSLACLSTFLIIGNWHFITNFQPSSGFSIWFESLLRWIAIQQSKSYDLNCYFSEFLLNKTTTRVCDSMMKTKAASFFSRLQIALSRPAFQWSVLMLKIRSLCCCCYVNEERREEMKDENWSWLKKSLIVESEQQPHTVATTQPLVQCWSRNKWSFFGVDKSLISHFHCLSCMSSVEPYSRITIYTRQYKNPFKYRILSSRILDQ